MGYILFLFIGMPILELFLLINVGGAIGVFPTIGIVILTAVLGTWMLKAQGISTLNKARSRLSGGQVPAFEMMEGMALGVGGALLLTPGFVTDAMGFVCLIPFTRRWLVNRLSKRVSIGGVAGGMAGGFSTKPTSGGQVPGYGPMGGNTTGAAPKAKIDGDVIEGEYTRKD